MRIVRVVEQSTEVGVHALGHGMNWQHNVSVKGEEKNMIMF